MRSSNQVSIKLLFILLTTSATTVTCLAQNYRGPNSALLPESWARKSSLNAVMPTYPNEAAEAYIAGVVRIRFGTNAGGEVVIIKVEPGTDPLLKKSVVDAVKQWRFKTWLGADGLEEPVFSRLAFHFIVKGGDPHVEMYNPGRHRPGDMCLACSRSYKEMIEWENWEEVWSKTEPNSVVPIPSLSRP